MASYRKKYTSHVASPERDDGSPVLSPPEVSGTKLPDPVADAPKPPEPIEPRSQSPADVAASTALKARLAEMERAEGLQRQQQQPQHAGEPQQPAMPAHVGKWLAEHPQYMDPNDQIAQAEINLATMKCVRDGLTWNDDDFLPSIERHLGLAPPTNGQSQHRPPPAPAAPVRQQQRSTVPMSAPPTREAPSMSTGRPASRRAPL